MIFNIYTLFRIMLMLNDIQYILSKREHIYEVVLLIGLKLTKFWESLVCIIMLYIIFSFTHVIPNSNS